MYDGVDARAEDGAPDVTVHLVTPPGRAAAPPRTR